MKTKTTIYAFYLCFIISLSLNAQDNTQKFRFGAKTGLNIANNTGDAILFFLEGTDKADSRLAISAGALAEYKLSNKFALQGELMLNSKGFKTEVYNTDAELKLTYINIPIFAKYYITDKLSLEAGPQIGFLLSSKANFFYSAIYGEYRLAQQAVSERDVKDDFKSTDFGLNLGLSYQLKSGLGFSARYYFGFTDILDLNYVFQGLKYPATSKKVLNNGRDYKLKNRVLNFSVFYMF